jgi:mannose-6-phosphate isomerase-like protein (cupin superfamily)
MPLIPFHTKTPTGSSFTVLADGERTAGELGVWTTAGVRGDAEPLRAHTRGQAAVVVLHGRCRVTVGDEELHVAAGDLVFVPPGIPHRLEVTSPTARWLTVANPAGPELLARALAVGSAADTEALLGLAVDCGVELRVGSAGRTEPREHR